jgi:predicted DNA-binding transcriptional regulator AlpA
MKTKIFKSIADVPMFMTVMDVAGPLGISRASAYELVKEKGFPKLNAVHGRIIVPRDRFFEWLDSREKYGNPV